MKKTSRDGNAGRPRGPHWYESDITRFLRAMVANNPRIKEVQSNGRALYWDRPLDGDEQQRFRQSSVPQKAYVYDPDLKPGPDRLANPRHTASDGQWD
jgi:hypothetical protein